MLTRQSNNLFCDLPVPVSQSGDPAGESSRSTSYGESLLADLGHYRATIPVAYDAAGYNHSTSPGLDDGAPYAVRELHSCGGSPSSPLHSSRRVPLSHVFAGEGGDTLLRMVKLLYPVGRASLDALSRLSGLPPALVRASIYRLKDHGIVTVEERMDHRGRLLWARLTEQGRRDLAVSEKGNPDAGA